MPETGRGVKQAGEARRSRPAGWRYSAGIGLPAWIAHFVRSRGHPLKLAGIFQNALLNARVPRLGGGWGLGPTVASRLQERRLLPSRIGVWITKS